MKLWRLVNQRAEAVAVPDPVRFDQAVDLVVAGLGTAGAVALITAARRGIKTLGIEKLTVMGGSATAGGISSYYCGIRGGVFGELDDASQALAAEFFAARSVAPEARHRVFHPEARHLSLEQAAVAAGARLAYDARITGVYLENREVRGIQWVSGGVPQNTACRVLIDATGDGEVAAMAGAEFLYGREFDGIPQPWSHVPCWIRDGWHSANNFDAGSTLEVTDGQAVSDGIAFGWTLHERETYTESEKLLFAGRLLGQREGRLISGETTVRLADVLAGRLASDPVFYEHTNLDTHTQDWAFESETAQEWLTVASLWGQNFGIPIPLQAMMVKGFDGLLTAGRCLSVDHDLAQAVRMQQAMQQCGEAVATAAAMALERGLPMHAVPYADVAAALRRTGCLPDTPPSMVTDLLPATADAIRERLASDGPGLAIWAARLAGDTLRPQLHEWIAAAEPLLARHSALALGLLGDSAALPLLRAMIRERDPYVPKTARSLNAPRLCAALYLAGRFGDADIAPDIETLLDTPALAFDLFSYALTALLRIGAANPDRRAPIATGIRRILENEAFKQDLPRHRIRTPEPSNAYFRMVAAQELDRWDVAHRLMDRIDPETLTPRETALYARLKSP